MINDSWSRDDDAGITSDDDSWRVDKGGRITTAIS